MARAIWVYNNLPIKRQVQYPDFYHFILISLVKNYKKKIKMGIIINMRNTISKEIFNNLETIWNDENGVEFVYARDLQKILGYEKWQKFEEVVKKAMISCETNGNPSVDHFGGTANMINIGKTAKREVQDYKLTRYACYLTAQNGDPRKEEIAFAQNYFAVQTRKFELV